MKFKNPANGHVESFTAPWLLAFLFGGFYFIAVGLWRPLLIWMLLSALLFGSMGPSAIVLVVIINVVFAAAAGILLRDAHLRKGWIEVADDSSSDGAPGAPMAPATLGPPAVGLRKCPFCAEEIKAEAIKCKHCGSDVATAQVAPRAEGEWAHPV
jgi:hypothetical protein